MKAPNHHTTPYAAIAIIAINLVAAAFVLGDQQAMWQWGFIPQPLVSVEFIARVQLLFTSLFVHVEPVHLLANLTIVASVGPIVEAASGSFRLLLIYLVSGVAGVSAHWLMVIAAQPRVASDPLIGASACVGGLIGYAWLRFYRAQVPILPKVRVSVYWLVIVWVALQVVGGLAANSMFGAPVAYWSHIGGFLTGFLLAVVLKAGTEAHAEAWSDRIAEAKSRGPAAQVAAAREYLSSHPYDREVGKALVEGLLIEGRREEAVRELKRVSKLPEPRHRSFAIVRLCELGEAQLISSAERFKTAFEMRKEEPELSERLAASILEDEHSDLRADALVLLIELTHETDPRGAKHFAVRLTREHAMSPQEDAAKRRWPELFR